MQLLHFLQKKMSMSHIYQPVMIKTLLENGGTASKNEIAKHILSYDQSQVEYYQDVTSKMVGKVLTKNGIVKKVGSDRYALVDFEGLKSEDLEMLIAECDHQIQAYVAKRGMKIWEHRRRNRKAVPGSIRYNVLKRAKGRCELCGVAAMERALEVDHIVPKNLGGADAIENYQALCYKCNANKRDSDNTDFRGLDDYYSYSEANCTFCRVKPNTWIISNNLSYAIRDKYPVTDGHTLVIPKRHFASFFDITQAELNAIYALASVVREELHRKYPNISGFNLGFNDGQASGQTISHCHFHIIPRRKDDVENPVGGIRNVIPGKGDYLNSSD